MDRTKEEQSRKQHMRCTAVTSLGLVRLARTLTLQVTVVILPYLRQAVQDAAPKMRALIIGTGLWEKLLSNILQLDGTLGEIFSY